ncbi:MULTISPECIES: hypothetical protein [Methylobacter]
MSASNTVDDIWRSYQITLDCLKIANHSIVNNDISSLAKTGFIGSPQDEAKRQIMESRSNADDYVILSLWASFERTLLSYVQGESNRILAEPTTNFTRSVHQKIDDEIEYWRVDDILNIFKTIISPDLIGQAKQVKKYRDWVAHRNIKKGSPPNVPPQTAYTILSEILKQLTNHACFQTSIQAA